MRCIWTVQPIGTVDGRNGRVNEVPTGGVALTRVRDYSGVYKDPSLYDMQAAAANLAAWSPGNVNRGYLAPCGQCWNPTGSITMK